MTDFMINRFKTPLLRFAVLALVVVGLSSCYMPIRFDAEIELSRRGYYEFFFDGYLAKVSLYEGLKKREISREEEQEQARNIETDFKRDRSTKEVKYFKKGHFKVNWERKGDLTKAKTVTFIRRNEHMLSISYNNKTGRVSVAGRSIKRDTKRQLAEMGLNMTGEIRVITDTNVISHNATSVKKLPKRGARFKMYTWKIKSIFDRTPSLLTTMR
jgi:hypothetical protein